MRTSHPRADAGTIALDGHGRTRAFSLAWVALSMLFGDRAKLGALVFGVAFATVLMAQQSAFCIGLIGLAGNAVRDIPEADVWIMRPGTRTIDNAQALPATALFRVRSVPGVQWALPLFRGNATVRIADGSAQPVSIIGVDDVSLLGLPQAVIRGRFVDLRGPDAIFVNLQGHTNLFPGRPLLPGGALELNDRRAVVAGIVSARPAFSGSNIVYTRYSNAVRFVPGGRNTMSFILVRAGSGIAPDRLAADIQLRTGLVAMTSEAFVRSNIDYLVETSGIVSGFGLIVALGAIVGVVIVALTLSLFVQDNVRFLGALKAIGVRGGELVRMVLVQALVSGLAGYCIGIGLTTALIELAADNVADFATFYLPWQVMAGTGAAVILTMVGAALLAIRRVRRVDPALVFRG